MLEQRNNNTGIFAGQRGATAGSGSITIDAETARIFISKVFSWMAIGLAITSFVAWAFASSEQLIGLLISESGMNLMGYVVMFAPFALVLLMSFRFEKMSSGTITLLFGGFSILMGMSLSFILLVFTASSVFQTFAVTAGMFGTMAIIGYTTKTNLSKFGAYLYMALIGLILASVINWFMQSSTMEYIISFAGVLIFTGLTAYDTQKLKRIGSNSEAYGQERTNKLVIMGALTLYLDFINLFLFLLRFLGDRR